MVKISGLPPDSEPSLSDKLPFVDVDASPPTTKHTTLQDLINSVFNNVPAGAIPGSIFDYVISGGVWTGDNYGSSLDGSMTAAVVYINSQSIPIDAVTARTFTASKDTYVDVLSNGDGTGQLVYTEVSNNAASPALAANSIRLAIIVTDSTDIQSAGSINQGQEDKVLPIASSIAYSVTDSLGNLICPRDPNRKILGYRQITSTFSTTTAGSAVDVTGLSVPVIVPSGRKIEIVTSGENLQSSQNSGNGVILQIQESSTVIQKRSFSTPSSNYAEFLQTEATITPSAGAHTYKTTVVQAAAGTLNLNTSSTSPGFIKVELA